MPKTPTAIPNQELRPWIVRHRPKADHVYPHDYCKLCGDMGFYFCISKSDPETYGKLHVKIHGAGIGTIEGTIPEKSLSIFSPKSDPEVSVLDPRI